MKAHHTLPVTILILLPAASIHTDEDSLEFAEKYLLHYGYLTQSDNTGQKQSAPLITSDSLQDYVRTFQEFAGLEVTGKLDKETMKMMRTPRCVLIG